MSLKLRLLNAAQGDSIILSYGENEKNHILIDGGIGRVCFKQLKDFIKSLEIKDEAINLLVLTHIDADHIDGILKLLSQPNFDFSIVKKMWFNFGERLQKGLGLSNIPSHADIYLDENTRDISLKQGIKLDKLLEGKEILSDEIIKCSEIFEFDGTLITVLSPNVDALNEFSKMQKDEKRDKSSRAREIASECDYQKSIKELNSKSFVRNDSAVNRSSIAFIFEYEKEKILFLGDSCSIDVENSLSALGYSQENPIDLLACKISHHASKHSTSNELVKMLNCKNYLVSTHLSSDGRPSKECLSRIICNSKQPVRFYCNYDIHATSIFSEEEFEKYKMEFIVLADEGIMIEELRI